MRDPYEALGIARGASQDDVQKAYRKLAKTHHPDLNPSDPGAEERFKEIAAAHALLADPETRARFDRGEIDASGQERPERHFYRGFAESPGGAKYAGFERGADAEDIERMFAELFGGGDAGGRGRERVRVRGQDLSYALDIDFLEAANGGVRTITLPAGGSLRLTIPEGARDGQILRLKGKGGPGFGGGPPGDAYVELRVRPHPLFRRKNGDIHVELPITLAEAVLGGKVTVPTVAGPVTMTVPKGSNTGDTLRLKGKGLKGAKPGPRGDQYVRLSVVLPPAGDAELEALVRRWAAKHPYDPRREPAPEAAG